MQRLSETLQEFRSTGERHRYELWLFGDHACPNYSGQWRQICKLRTEYMENLKDAGQTLHQGWVYNMQTVYVIIPFFQRDEGILRRTINSVLGQEVPDGWQLKIIVVDDGSPVSAASEVRSLVIGNAFELKIIQQTNAGAAAARNRGLDEASEATLVAFVDSDDVWPVQHIARAIEAYRLGYDFLFADNTREGHHQSYMNKCALLTRQAIEAAPHVDGFAKIDPRQLSALIVKEFPTQISTVVYQPRIAATLRFDTNLKCAGEDVLFFTQLASLAQNPVFDTKTIVECGDGINMYFANFSWDSPPYLAITVDQVLLHRTIANLTGVPQEARRVNHGEVLYVRRQLAFHVIRNLLKHPLRVPPQIWRLLKREPVAALQLPFDMCCCMLQKLWQNDDGTASDRAAYKCQ